MQVRILVTGDIHIGKRSSAVSGGSEHELSTRYTWQKIVDYAIEHVDILVLTGDIIDWENRFFEAAAPLQQGLKKLNEQGVEVIIVAGNHDYDVLPQIVWMEELPHIHLLGKEGNWESYIYRKDGNAIQFIGWSFPDHSYTLNPIDHLNALMIERDISTIAVVHGDAYPAADSRYAPLYKERMLDISHVDAWLLGHIHKPELLRADNPLILYPGSPHALNPKEQGAHGPYLLTVEGSSIQCDQLSFSPVRYEKINIDISNCLTPAEVKELIYRQLNRQTQQLEQTINLQYIVYDILLTGEYNNTNDLNALQDQLAEFSYIGLHKVSVRSLNYDTQPRIRIEQYTSDPSYMGFIAKAIIALENGVSDDFTDKLVAEWKTMYTTLAESPVYKPLNIPIEAGDLEQEARTAILAQYKQIISEFNRLRNEN